MSENLSAAETARWTAGRDEVAQRIGARFARSEPRQRALAYFQGLLRPVERKKGWQLAQPAGAPSPYGVQPLLGRATWEADEVRDELRAQVVEQLGDPEGVLLVEETGFLKKGEQSAGVPRPYSGTAGGVENCQIGVFLADQAPGGRSFLDRALSLPRSWTEDPERGPTAGLPETVRFATKLTLARQMSERALAHGVPARWVTGDSVYGSDRHFRRFLQGRRIASVLGITSDYPVRPYTVGGRADTLPPSSWKRRRAGAGRTGPRRDEWALHRMYWDETGWGHWLLMRRQIGARQERAYYRVFAPADTTLEEMVAVAGKRGAVEECVETAKGECGLDEYEVRTWTGWHRHITLSLLAHAYLTVVRAQAVRAAPLKKRKRSSSGKKT